jgi:hypothetical protein
MMLFKGGDEGPKQNLKFIAFYGEKYSAMTSNWLRVSERGRIWLQAALALGFLLTPPNRVRPGFLADPNGGNSTVASASGVVGACGA